MENIRITLVGFEVRGSNSRCRVDLGYFNSVALKVVLFWVHPSSQGPLFLHPCLPLWVSHTFLCKGFLCSVPVHFCYKSETLLLPYIHQVLALNCYASKLLQTEYDTMAFCMYRCWKCYDCTVPDCQTSWQCTHHNPTLFSVHSLFLL